MTSRDVVTRSVSERDFQGFVVSFAEWHRWRVWHDTDSRRNHAGWPDLVLCRPPELIVVELKTEKGAVTGPQQWWLAALAGCGLETHCWRPSDTDAVMARLSSPNGTS